MSKRHVKGRPAKELPDPVKYHKLREKVYHKAVEKGYRGTQRQFYRRPERQYIENLHDFYEADTAMTDRIRDRDMDPSMKVGLANTNTYAFTIGIPSKIKRYTGIDNPVSLESLMSPTSSIISCPIEFEVPISPNRDNDGIDYIVFDPHTYRYFNDFCRKVLGPQSQFIWNTLVCPSITIIPNGDVQYWWFSPYVHNNPPSSLMYYNRLDNVPSSQIYPKWNYITAMPPTTMITLASPFSSHDEHSKMPATSSLVVPLNDGNATIIPEYFQNDFNYTRSYPFLEADQVIYYKFKGVKRIVLHCYISIHKHDKYQLWDFAPNPY